MKVKIRKTKFLINGISFGRGIYSYKIEYVDFGKPVKLIFESDVKYSKKIIEKLEKNKIKHYWSSLKKIEIPVSEIDLKIK